MTHHLFPRVLKDRVLASPRPYDFKGTLVLDGYIKEILLENRNLTVNQEHALRIIQDRIVPVFGPLLQLWSIISVEKEQALADLNANGEYTSELKQICSLF